MGDMLNGMGSVKMAAVNLARPACHGTDNIWNNSGGWHPVCKSQSAAQYWVAMGLLWGQPASSPDWSQQQGQHRS